MSLVRFGLYFARLSVFAWSAVAFAWSALAWAWSVWAIQLWRALPLATSGVVEALHRHGFNATDKRLLLLKDGMHHMFTKTHAPVCGFASPPGNLASYLAFVRSVWLDIRPEVQAEEAED